LAYTRAAVAGTRPALRHHPLSRGFLVRVLVMLLSVFSLFAFSGAVQARQAPLADPAPVSIPAKLTQDQVVKDIKRALIGRGWTITAERAGEIESTLYLRDHVAVVRVTWDTQTIRIAYVDSKNLDYKVRNGKTYIHPNYLGWVSNIAKDMNTNLQLTALE
jgi:hypothetical protein